MHTITVYHEKKNKNETNHFNILLNELVVTGILQINFALFVVKENLISIIAKNKCDNQLTG